MKRILNLSQWIHQRNVSQLGEQDAKKPLVQRELLIDKKIQAQKDHERLYGGLLR